MRIEAFSEWNGVDRAAPRDNSQRAVPEVSPKEGDVDQAEWSPAGQLLGSASQQIATVPDVRHDRVQELQTAVQQGTYSVSSEQIANAMVNDLRGLPGFGGQ